MNYKMLFKILSVFWLLFFFIGNSYSSNKVEQLPKSLYTEDEILNAMKATGVLGKDYKDAVVVFDRLHAFVDCYYELEKSDSIVICQFYNQSAARFNRPITRWVIVLYIEMNSVVDIRVVKKIHEFDLAKHMDVKNESFNFYMFDDKKVLMESFLLKKFPIGTDVEYLIEELVRANANIKSKEIKGAEIEYLLFKSPVFFDWTGWYVDIDCNLLGKIKRLRISRTKL